MPHTTAGCFGNEYRRRMKAGNVPAVRVTLKITMTVGPGELEFIDICSIDLLKR